MLKALHPFSEKITPQTFPVIVRNYDRDALYFKLNEAGFGAVSLYHTMIDPIQKGDYEEAVWLSKHIINLPVHQDVTEVQIEEMADTLFYILKT